MARPWKSIFGFFVLSFVWVAVTFVVVTSRLPVRLVIPRRDLATPLKLEALAPGHKQELYK